MDKKEVLDLVKKFDLNEYEAKAFTALLTEGMLAAAEVSRKALIPRPRVYDVLLSLERKGFVDSLPGRPVRFKPRGLNSALQNYEKTRKKALYYKIQELKEIRNTLEKRLPKASKKEESAEVLILRGRDNIYSKLSELLGNASREVTIMAPKQGLSRKKGFFEKELYKAKNRRVKVSFKEAQARIALIDSKAIVFLDEDNEEQERALLVHSPYLVGSLKKRLG